MNTRRQQTVSSGQAPRLAAAGSGGPSGRRPTGRWRAAGLGAALLAMAGACVSSSRTAVDVLHPQSAEAVREIIAQSRKPVLIAFTSDACVTCRSMRPALTGVAQDYAGRLLVVEADLALTGALIGEYNLMKVPTVIILRDGREVARRHGLLPAPFMASFINNALRAKPQ